MNSSLLVWGLIVLLVVIAFSLRLFKQVNKSHFLHHIMEKGSESEEFFVPGDLSEEDYEWNE